MYEKLSLFPVIAHDPVSNLAAYSVVHEDYGVVAMLMMEGAELSLTVGKKVTVEVEEMISALYCWLVNAVKTLMGMVQ